MDGMDEIVQEFVVESHENLDQLDRDLVALEQSPGSRELLSSIFRTIHTIKGTSGFLAFGRLESVAHVGENLLSRLRDGVQQMTPETTDVLLAMVDTIRDLLEKIERTGAEGDVPVEHVIAQVTACIEGTSAAKTEPEPEATLVEVEAAPKPARRPRAKKIAAAEVPSSQVTAVVEEPAPAAAAAEPEPGEGPTRRSATETSIRVDVDLLDSLMRLVGELVLTRNQVVRSAATQSDVALIRATQRLNLITTELQESVMKTRMQPIDHIWAKLPRVVRDLSSQLGKQVTLEMHGKETELDRTLLEAVKDPLTHLVRNAVDHGVEDPEIRAAAGKPETGVLGLKAFHEGGHVVVEVTDDGAGIDPDKVGATAVKRGLITADQLDRMRRDEILDLLFRAGFSTKAEVTNVSGRGVGMDVVRTNIEKIGGTVDVESTIGKGTTWRLTIPLTLAIVQALTVECAGERYAIPQVAVHELVSVDTAGTGVEYVAGAPVYRLRGRLLPLVRMDDALGVGGGKHDGPVFLAVVQADGRRFGMVVDRVLNTEEIVVKPLSSRLKGAGVYAGATILGDGRVALILDVQALARRTQLGAEAVAAVEAAAAAEKDTAVTTDTVRLLVASVGDRRVAVPLDSVTRLEDFPLSAVEHVGHREVVQYRGEIMPLVRLGRLLGSYDESQSESLPVVVYSERGRSVALAVDRIVDIIDGNVDARSDLDDSGLIGSAVIQKKVTEMLDVRQAILAADPRFFESADVPVGAEV
ncbi:MAG TPA: chemotaxis protein CheW [Mycobacteriales bacterium]|jgi:two-component system chemotaxis sensor kinase CheA|nr:chemotaxis protein CheW [Mycobacteriales bacterium]